jgi:hypothetical protein
VRSNVVVEGLQGSLARLLLALQRPAKTQATAAAAAVLLL